jgi:subtilisin-like proprotein convertase family protein
VTCHNEGGDDGAGDLNHNIFQIGDGINRTSGVPRNPPAVLGNGFRQQIGIEMTNELKAQLASAKATAASTNTSVTQALASKGTSFGSIVVAPDGTVNFAGLVGVDTDLVVKPFGWKGREATIRRFIEGGFRVHFGMQSSPSIAKHCANPNVNTFGNGPDCHDPDGDGVIDEIPEGLLTAEAVYMGLRETPVRIAVRNQARANAGEALFNQVGCATCHNQIKILNSSIHTEPADTTGGAGITYNLAVDNKDPKPAPNAAGQTAVETWSDFKRHDVGTALADSKNFNQIAANQFITPPLWGVADTAPYLHDGRAPTLADAILQHAGDALAVRNAYAALTADQQAQIVEFLGTLGRNEDPRVRAFNSTTVPVAIPDNNPTGVNATISVAAGPDIQHVLVSTNITHTYRGDLVIQVIAPNGQTATLSNRQGGSAHDFVATDLDITSSFTAGAAAAGTWRLFVRDLAAIDVGTINSFSIVLTSSR